MNDGQLDDLKQFIASTVSQTEERLRNELVSKDDLAGAKSRLEQKIDNLEQKVDDGFAGAGQAIEEIHVEIDKINVDVDQKLTKLERQAV